MRFFARPARLGGIVLGGVASAAALGAAAAFRWPLPRTSGTLRLPGLSAPVEVIRDRWGIPHIYAAGTADLFMAQGYVHAQDRLWQMELHRRLGQGQLAEIFGPRALPADRFLRTLGFGRTARREAALLDGSVREAIEAYTRGVNVFLDQRGLRLPLEFMVLRLRPRPWEVADALVFGKVMALNLCENWTTELLRARIIAAVGAGRATLLESGYPQNLPLAIPALQPYGSRIGEEALEGAQATQVFAGAAEAGQGSNAWAVAGSRSATGRPLLANDPHLAIQMPSLWYENHLDGGDIHVTGASIPGSPGVVIGHNERIAWGATNGMTDVQDLYIERFDPADPTRYEFRGAWERAEVVREEIVVRGQSEPVVEEVRVTRHGPVVDTAPAGAPGGDGAVEGPLALRWIALQPGQLNRALLALNRAHDWQSFRAALADWTAPAQNFVYADVDGHIGYALGGAIPVRAQGDGRLPVPGWSGDYEWTGVIPHAELPHVLDPAEGFVVTANNRIVDDSYPYALPGEWLPGYRAARIRALIEQTPAHDASSFARIHRDRRSLPGLQLAALSARLPAATGASARAREIFGAWDGDMAADSIGATIYARFCEKLLAAAYADAAAPLAAAAALDVLPGQTFLGVALPYVLRRAAEGDDGWLPEGRTWNGLLSAAWDSAIGELRAEYGDDVTTWRYGRAP
jgi:penicillin amidase